MEVNKDAQKSILEAVKSKMDPAYSFADELADCLSISKDSAYRRIRGDTLFDIAEVEILTRKFDLSLDKIFQLENSTISFNTESINQDNFKFEDYLKSVLTNLSIIQKLAEKDLFYSARDIFPPHYYQIPELSAFKLYFWLKSYVNHPDFRDLDFDLENLPKGLESSLEIARRSWDAYLKIPSTEIWTYETANITLRQIEYCREGGHINQRDSIVLCEKFRELTYHIKHQAEIGRKYNLNSEALEEGARFNLYFNETAIGDNSILFKMGDKKMAFITYGSINFLATADDKFCNIIEGHFNNTMKHAILISETSDKIRNRFFKKLLNKIQILEQRVSEMSDMF